MDRHFEPPQKTEMSGQFNASAVLPPVPITWQVVWAQDLARNYGGEKQPLAPARNQTPAVKSVA
jgi:hypothetical protein